MHALTGAVRALRAALTFDDFDDAAARALGVRRSDLRALDLLEHGPLPTGTFAQGSDPAVAVTDGHVLAREVGVVVLLVAAAAATRVVRGAGTPRSRPSA